MSNKKEQEEIKKKNREVMSKKDWDEFIQSKEYQGSEKFGNGDKDFNQSKK
jgi:hypothetical protein